MSDPFFFLRQVLSWLLWNSLWRLGRPPTIDTRHTHAHMHRISSYLYPVMPLAGDEGREAVTSMQWENPYDLSNS